MPPPLPASPAAALASWFDFEKETILLGSIIFAVIYMCYRCFRDEDFQTGMETHPEPPPAPKPSKEKAPKPSKEKADAEAKKKKYEEIMEAIKDAEERQHIEDLREAINKGANLDWQTHHLQSSPADLIEMCGR